MFVDNTNVLFEELALAPQQAWYLYVLRTGRGHLYTGITTNIARRLRQHRGELVGGAKALRGKGPLTLVYQAGFPDRRTAAAAEYRLKQLSKTEKETMIRTLGL